MTDRRELYRSPNGDSWFLGREPTDGDAAPAHDLARGNAPYETCGLLDHGLESIGKAELPGPRRAGPAEFRSARRGRGWLHEVLHDVLADLVAHLHLRELPLV